MAGRDGLLIAAGAFAGLLAGAVAGRTAAPSAPPAEQKPAVAEPPRDERPELPQRVTRDDEARGKAQAAELRAEKVAGELLAVDAKVAALSERLTERAAQLERAIAAVSARIDAKPAAPTLAAPDERPAPEPPIDVAQAEEQKVAPAREEKKPEEEPAPATPASEKKREAEIAKRTAAIERELRPIVERWYQLRDYSAFDCRGHKPGCKLCFSNMSYQSGQKAFFDLMSPAAQKKAGDPAAFFDAIAQGRVLADQRGNMIKLTRSKWIGLRLEDKVAVVRCAVTWYQADNPETEHESRWVLVKKRFYLAGDGEVGDQLLPR